MWKKLTNAANETNRPVGQTTMLPTLLLGKKEEKTLRLRMSGTFIALENFAGNFDITRELCCRQCYWDSSANEQQRERMLDLTYMRHVSVGADLAYLCDIYCIIYIIMKTQMYIGIPLTWIPSIFFFPINLDILVEGRIRQRGPVFRCIIGNMDVYLNESTICRLCAADNGNEHLFTNETGESDLCSLVNRYLPLKVGTASFFFF